MNSLTPVVPSSINSLLISNGYKREPSKPGYVNYIRFEEAVSISGRHIEHSVFYLQDCDRASEWIVVNSYTGIIEDLLACDWNNLLLMMMAVKPPVNSNVNPVFQKLLKGIL